MGAYTHIDGAWGERQAFLRDESRWNALQEAAARDCGPVVEEAISTVFEATGDETGFMRVWTVDPKRAQHLCRRAGWKVRLISIRLPTPTVEGS